MLAEDPPGSGLYAPAAGMTHTDGLYDLPADLIPDPAHDGLYLIGD